MKYTKITKPTAKKLFDEGNEIHMVPSNLNINSPWVNGGFVTSKEMDPDTPFERLVTYHTVMNCINNQTGRYTRFYIKEGE